jgi:hypothetical protein
MRVLLLFVIPAFLLAWKMESGTVTLPATSSGSSTWQTVDLNQTYDVPPLVFALVNEGSGHPGDTPVIVRVNNITTTSFDIIQVESESIVELVVDQGPHPSVEVHYLVIDEGDHTLPDGTRFFAGTYTTQTKQGKNIPNPKGWDTVNILPVFSSTPVILGMVQGIVNETRSLPGEPSSPWLTTTIRNVNNGSFGMAVERAETADGSMSSDENLAYLAISAGVQSTLYDLNTCEVIDFETIRTSDSIRGWTTTCTNFNFVNTYGSTPNVIGSQNTRDGGDGGWLRRCFLDTSAVGLTVDEDQAADSERSHTTERAGLVIFEKSFTYDSTKTLPCKSLVIDYRFDECYWLNGSGGVIADVKDSSGNLNHATSESLATVDTNTRQICASGSFGQNGDRVTTDNASVLGALNTQLTISVWLYPTAFNEWSSAVQKVTNDGWTDGFGFIHESGDGTNITFYINNAFSGTGRVSTSLTMNTWNHIVGVYDGTNVSIYRNGVLVDSSAYSTTIINSVQPLTIGNDFLSASYNDVWEGNIDEVKIWEDVLDSTEISTIYNNEFAQKNLDGSERVCKVCDTNASAGIWGLIGIPADFRTAINKDVADVFDEFPSGSYNVPSNSDGWIVFKRNYSISDNSSSYSIVPYTGESLEFGQGYWLLSKVDQSWSENGLPSTDYNATNSACPADSCVEIDLTPVSKNFSAPDNDPNDGSGPNRNNMLGFIGQEPVNWSDCRIIVDGISYTPSASESAGYSEKQIWQYNPGDLGANANGYTTCDDITPGTCKLEPYKGFWLILHGKTKGKTVKLLIPKE